MLCPLETFLAIVEPNLVTYFTDICQEIFPTTPTSDEMTSTTTESANAEVNNLVEFLISAITVH